MKGHDIFRKSNRSYGRSGRATALSAQTGSKIVVLM
jgi:hypothetical protein